MMEYVTCLKMRGIDVRATKHWDQNSERMELADLKGVCMLVLETFNLGNPSKRLDTYGYSQSPCMVAARNRYVQSLCWCFNTPAMNTSTFFWGRFDYVYLGIGCGLTFGVENLRTGQNPGTQVTF